MEENRNLIQKVAEEVSDKIGGENTERLTTFVATAKLIACDSRWSDFTMSLRGLLRLFLLLGSDDHRCHDTTILTRTSRGTTFVTSTDINEKGETEPIINTRESMTHMLLTLEGFFGSLEEMGDEDS